MFIGRANQSRRRMLKSTTCALFMGAFGRPVTGAAFEGANVFKKSADLDTLLSSSMKAIGREYLSKYPDEKSKTALLNSLQSQVSVANGDSCELSREELKKSIMYDFKTDNVVYLKGWSLSRTEARLAALSVV